MGERVRRYHVEAKTGGQWQTVAHGTIIGQRNLLRIPAVTTEALRLVIDEAAACPAICCFGAYHSELAIEVGSGSLAAQSAPRKPRTFMAEGLSTARTKLLTTTSRHAGPPAIKCENAGLEVDLRKPRNDRPHHDSGIRASHRQVSDRVPLDAG